MKSIKNNHFIYKRFLKKLFSKESEKGGIQRCIIREIICERIRKLIISAKSIFEEYKKNKSYFEKNYIAEKPKTSAHFCISRFPGTFSLMLGANKH